MDKYKFSLDWRSGYISQVCVESRRRPILRYHANLLIEEESYNVLSHRFHARYTWDVHSDCAASAASPHMRDHRPLTTHEKNRMKMILERFEVSHLPGNKRFRITVAAENAFGIGAYSDLSTGVSTKPAMTPAAILAVDLYLYIYLYIYSIQDDV